MKTKKPKRPADFMQRAKMIVDIATGDKKEEPVTLSSYASEFARKGGLVGGKARAESLSAKQRSMIARKAARARWKKNME